MQSSPMLDGFQNATIPAILRLGSLPGLLLAVFLSLASPARADERKDWTGYAWKRIDIASCAPQAKRMICPLYEQRWDWKRNQWVAIAISYNTKTGAVDLVQRLTNNDNRDDDYVCVTALIVDTAGHNLIVHHQNWHMDPLSTQQQVHSYRSAHMASAAAIHIGSKQCRLGADQDQDIYDRDAPPSATKLALPRPWHT